LYGPGATVEAVVVGVGVLGFALGFAVVAGAAAVGTVGTVSTVGTVTVGAVVAIGAAMVVETPAVVDADSLESGGALFGAASEHAASRATATTTRTDRLRIVT